jgi:hypothetical protein
MVVEESDSELDEIVSIPGYQASLLFARVSGNGKDTKYGNGGFCGYLKRDYHSREYWVSKEG